MSKLWLPILILLALGSGLLSGVIYATARSDAHPDAHSDSLPVAAPAPVPESHPLELTSATDPLLQAQVPLSIAPATTPDPASQALVETYLNTLEQRGFSRTNQGVWIQTNDQLLASHQGTVPIPAASVTKVATTLAALQTFGPDHRFQTRISTTGSIQAGVLQGDLLIQGDGDPFFVWEDAIAIGNLLNQAGIRQVTGNILISGPFYMNFQTDPITAGILFQTGINSSRWPSEALTQYQTLPAGTPQPQVTVTGSVQLITPVPESTLIVNHRSFPVAELLKKMNRFSNNIMADMLANRVGGAATVAQIAAESTGLPATEVQLINGSGLGIDNRISPRAAVAMLLAIQDLLPDQMTVGNLFEVIGEDTGVLVRRVLPSALIAKSGTLNQVSSLAGSLSTQQDPVIWFAVMNTGYDVEGFRRQQGTLLQQVVNQRGIAPLSPQIAPNRIRDQLKSESQLVGP